MKWIQTLTYKHYRLLLLCFTHYPSVHIPLTNKINLSLGTWGVLKKGLAFGNTTAHCVLTKTQGLTSFFLPLLQVSWMNRRLQSYCLATSCLYCCKQEAEYIPSYRAFSGTSVLSHYFGEKRKKGGGPWKLWWKGVSRILSRADLQDTRQKSSVPQSH